MQPSVNNPIDQGVRQPNTGPGGEPNAIALPITRPPATYGLASRLRREL
jgi:hypothetical protein